MAVNKRTTDLLHELEKIDEREEDILDVLLRRGARLEEAEQRSRQVNVGDLQALTGALASLETAIDAAIAHAGSNGNGVPAPASIDALAAGLREQDAAADRLRAQLRERLAALGVEAGEPAETAPPKRTFRVADPRMTGADVKAFQHVLNQRLDAWGIHDRIAENGTYGPETRKAARMVAFRLGVAEADYEHGFTPELRRLIRTPSHRTPEQLRRARRRRGHEPAKAKPVAAKPRHSGRAAAIHAAGGRYGELIVREAKRSGLLVSLVCAVVEQETHFRNVFGHDKVSNPVKSPPKGLLEVTEERYKRYLEHRHRGEGAQGVGPMQLTSPGLQDRADELGGCWKPGPNIRVGCEYLAGRIKARGLHAGVQAYNGAPGDDYSKSVLALQAKWKARLAGAHDDDDDDHDHDHAPVARRRTFTVRHPELKGADVKAFQRDVNHRLAAWGIHTDVDEDGEYGSETAAAARKVAYGLGIAVADYQHGFTPELRALIHTPSRRTAQQLERARARTDWRRKLRKHDAKARRGGALRLAAYAEARRLVGTMEVGGNNRGKTVLEIIRANGGKGPEAWCGDFVAWCYRKAGSKSVNRNWAGVALYLPMTGLARTRNPQKGDLVRYTFSHIGLFGHWCDARGHEVPASRATHIKTIEGNTGHSGAVSDSTTGGDGVYMKIRARNLVKDFIHVSR